MSASRAAVSGPLAGAGPTGSGADRGERDTERLSQVHEVGSLQPGVVHGGEACLTALPAGNAGFASDASLAGLASNA